MFSYMRAELYKTLHRQYTYLFLLSVLAMEAMLIGGFAYFNSLSDGAIDFYSGASTIVMMFSVGLYATVITGDIVFSEQYKHNTLKNEVSYGIPRARIYLGKLLTECVVALVSCLIIVAFYVGLCILFLPQGARSGDAFALIGYCLAVALPLWLGCQALVNMLYFFLKSATVASFLFAGILVGAGPIFELMGALVSDVFNTLHSILLTTPIDVAPNLAGDWAYCGQSWLIGLGWFALSTGVGLWFFRKKEIS